ncbi:KDP operon transcriptional regulatory protein KdpE [Falsiruegeria litorea R37]|uniref:KDP operon transcriptional regulatory protein KdpE n=1 Tax=Falsiruegeria litorea R37 TaxID=1200284 RepID=A0A1Y5RYV5_9RHOB|nr:response regulator [Falsiruegeria litorea]SLN28818.1 KDP operon transcriptional regulatory protein KdpE [Falsiruegeria litorea R37]
MNDSDPFASPLRIPTATRPLLGLTILVVEDSRYACEAMRLLCLRSGARIRRADCLKSARRHLQIYRPSVIIVDLGLPDGSGADLIEELANATPRVGVILGTSGDEFAEDTAIAAGADGFLAKPITSLAVFQTAVLSKLPADRHPSGPRVMHDETIDPDPIAYQDDMAHVADVLTDTCDGKTLDYVAQFVSGVARSASDTVLANAARDLAKARAKGAPVATDAARVAGLIQERLDRRKAI